MSTLNLQPSPKFPVCLLPLGLFRLDILKTPRIAHSLYLFGPSRCRRLTCRHDRNAAESLRSRPYNVALIAIEATMKGTVKRSLPQSHTHTYTHWHSTTSWLRFTLVVGVCWTYRNEDATRFPFYNTYMHCFVCQPPTHNSHSRSGEFLSYKQPAASDTVSINPPQMSCYHLIAAIRHYWSIFPPISF